MHSIVGGQWVHVNPHAWGPTLDLSRCLLSNVDGESTCKLCRERPCPSGIQTYHQHIYLSCLHLFNSNSAK